MKFILIKVGDKVEYWQGGSGIVLDINKATHAICISKSDVCYVHTMNIKTLNGVRIDAETITVNESLVDTIILSSIEDCKTWEQIFNFQSKTDGESGQQLRKWLIKHFNVPTIK